MGGRCFQITDGFPVDGMDFRRQKNCVGLRMRVKEWRLHQQDLFEMAEIAGGHAVAKFHGRCANQQIRERNTDTSRLILASIFPVRRATGTVIE